MRRLAIPLVPLIASGCVQAPAPSPPAPTPPATPAPPRVAGLDRVMGHDASAAIALLGPPALDLREGPARKLQFRGAACVLDAYLYPAPDGGAATVKWVDARTPVGGEFDKSACVEALARR